MSIYKIKIIKDYQFEQYKLEVGMNVELVCPSSNPTDYNGFYIEKYFKKKYGFYLDGIGWNTLEFLELIKLMTLQ